MIKYEYMAIALAATDHVSEINRYGALGWRLVSILKEQQWGAKKPTYYAYFERVKP
jgi:hypothetical protein